MVRTAALIMAATSLLTAQTPPPEEMRQLPRAMHARMKELPTLRVDQQKGDIVGNDNRALQAAVDYVAGLGGGTVEIGEGTFLMRDSLHLRSNVTVRGQGEKTILVKAPSAGSPLAMDGDYGEEQITLKDPAGFQVGDGVAIWDKNSPGFYTTVARITGKNGNTFSISRPLHADYTVEAGAQAATVFPVISGYDLEGVRIERITVDGARERNVSLNGCRGGGIFLYRGYGSVIEQCHVRNYNGDGISFQQSNDVRLLDSISEGNAELGLHPGSGSQRPIVRNCVARNNGSDGLYLCWRVKNGVFESNQLLNNGRHGISIGHKDTDNLLTRNIVRDNASDGVYFRNEAEALAGHRNTLEDNAIENNGRVSGGSGIMVDGVTKDVVIRGNTIRDTREGGERTQKTAIRVGSKAGKVTIEGNKTLADKDLDDQRSKD